MAADVAKDRNAVGDAVEANRVELAEAIESDTYIESVDSISYDRNTGTVSVSATTTYAGEYGGEYRLEESWEVYRNMAVLWKADDGAWRTPLFSPALAFTNGDESYTCSGDFMNRLADRQADQPAWQSECSG